MLAVWPSLPGLVGEGGPASAATATQRSEVHIIVPASPPPRPYVPGDGRGIITAGLFASGWGGGDEGSAAAIA